MAAMASFSSPSLCLLLPPMSLSLDRNVIDPSELSSLLASTAQNCLQFPSPFSSSSSSSSSSSFPRLVQPVKPSKLRVALRNSTVVVSIHMNLAEDFHVVEADCSTHRDGRHHGYGTLIETLTTQGLGLSSNIFFSKDPRERRQRRRRTLVAFGRATSDEALTASIYDLVVAPSLQRQGLGRRVLHQIIRELLRRDITDIAALTTPEQRPFFSACGFAEDELQSTTMMYLRGSIHTDSDNLKHFGRQRLIVPALLRQSNIP